jgi:hypothetical protein
MIEAFTLGAERKIVEHGPIRRQFRQLAPNAIARVRRRFAFAF